MKADKLLAGAADGGGFHILTFGIATMAGDAGG
jgi:hypothetical protein